MWHQLGWSHNDLLLKLVQPSSYLNTSTIFPIKMCYLHCQYHFAGGQSIQIMWIQKHIYDEFKLENFNLFQCKEWGFLLLEMFGRSLGTGDYGHLTVEHVPMLFRVHRSLHHLSNQGFEAAHKLQWQLYARATSHDSSGDTASCKFISVCTVQGCPKLDNRKWRK